MTSAGIILCVSAVVLIAIGLPIAYALSAAGLITLSTGASTVSLMVFPQRFFAAINSFPLMAIIFFVIAGELMMQGVHLQAPHQFSQPSFSDGCAAACRSSALRPCAFFGAISGSAAGNGRRLSAG
jgi:C4-dicarboxylate transporter DctM subunit